MAVKIFDGGEWKSVSLQRRGSSAFGAATLKRRGDGEWQTVYPSTHSYTRDFALSRSACYWNNGLCRSESELACGAEQASVEYIQRTMLWFDSDIYTELSGAVISSVQLYIQRRGGTHGPTRSMLGIKSHIYPVKPDYWPSVYALARESVIDGYVSMARSEGKWITIENAVAEQIGNGSCFGLTLDAGSSYVGSYYGLYSRDNCVLRVSYKK